MRIGAPKCRHPHEAPTRGAHYQRSIELQRGSVRWDAPSVACLRACAANAAGRWVAV
jgi:hypothetical protein